MPTTSDPTTTDHDVIVVGARCAGAATAMLLARAGHDVLVVDRADLPSDTLSTHALARGGVVQLARWGLLDEVLATGAPPIRTASFQVPGAPPLVRTIKASAGVDHLLAPRRYILDDILLGAARRAGASVKTGVTVTGVLRDDRGRVTGVELRERDGSVREVRSRLVVGADGVRSRIARAVGARVLDSRPIQAAGHYTYASGLGSEGFEFHVADGGFAGIFPTNGGEDNLWVCVPAHRALRGTARADAFLELLGTISPSLAERARGATMTAPVRGAANLPNHVLEGAGPGWALAGDAGYHRDPVTGHGITDAFRDAELLATHASRALRGVLTEAEAMAAYDAERIAALGPIFDVTCALAAYPPVADFVELQRTLSTLIEAEAQWLASLPPVPSRDDLAAA